MEVKSHGNSIRNTVCQCRAGYRPRGNTVQVREDCVLDPITGNCYWDIVSSSLVAHPIGHYKAYLYKDTRTAASAF